MSDQGPNFQKLFKVGLYLSEEDPDFSVDTSKIVYFFDIPHLSKSTRNNFFEYIFILENGEVKNTRLVQCTIMIERWNID